jgi:hypothetical protein
MLQALNMAEMAKKDYWRATIEEMKYPNKKARAQVRDEKMRGVEFP